MPETKQSISDIYTYILFLLLLMVKKLLKTFKHASIFNFFLIEFLSTRVQYTYFHTFFLLLQIYNLYTCLQVLKEKTY